MALENQPVFRAPSLPKMGKTTVSSSVFSNVAKVKSGFSLNKSKFSFIRPLQKVIQPDQLKPQVSGVETTNVASTLVETNRILVEIQKQLALDFANRITEKKQLLELSRRSALKQKAVKKENFVERGKNLAKGVLAPFQKVIAPAKGIFDKLIEFITLVGGGILLNNAWDWLSKKENQEKLKKVFDFLVDNWKLLLGIGIGVKLLGVVRAIKTAFSILRGAIGLLGKLLKRIRKPPGSGGPGGTGGKGGTPPPGGCPPPNCFDGPVTDIIRQKFRERSFIDDILVPAIIGAGYVLGKPKPIETPAPEVPATEPVKEPTEKPVEKPVFNVQELLRRPSGKYTPAESQFLIDQGYDDFVKGGQTQSPISDLVGITALIAAVKTAPIWGPALLTQAGKLKGLFGRTPAAASGAAKTPGPRLDPSKIDPTRISQTATSRMGQGASSGIKKIDFRGLANRHLNFLEKSKPTQTSLKTEVSDILNRASRSALDAKDQAKLNAIRSYAEKRGFGDVVARLKEYGIQSIDEMRAAAKLSKGGTVFGQGSQTTDSVPAMLAPGEEVIRASAANQFRPLLKDINDNAGRMFVALSNSITTQTKNNQIQEETNTKFTNLIEDFNKQLEDLIQKQRMPKSLREKLEEISGRSTSYLMGGPKQPTTSQTLKVTATPKSAPKSIQTYRRSGKSSGSGQPTIVNMPMPAINLAGNQAPEPPNTNVQEPSTAPISIISFDSSNPYISEVISSYGIFI